MESAEIQHLLGEARLATQSAAQAPTAIMGHASRLQEAIFGLHASGMSIRAVAEQLGVSPAVVQNAISQARSSRPKIERRENRVTYELHRAIAQRLDENPYEVISKGLDNVAQMRPRQRSSISKGWVSTWDQLLRGDVEKLKEAMLEISSDAEDLRQMSPFSGVLSDSERLLAIRKASFNSPSDAAD